MKINPALIAALALPLVAPLAAGQAQSQPPAPSPEQRAAMRLAVQALLIASNVVQQSFDGYLAIYIDERTWPAAFKDDDLGPFLALRSVEPRRRAVIIFPPSKNAAINGSAVCVFFDLGTPSGVAAAHGTSRGDIDKSGIPGSYQPITPQMMKPTLTQFDIQLTPSDINTDDGTALTAFHIALVPAPLASLESAGSLPRRLADSRPELSTVHCSLVNLLTF